MIPLEEQFHLPAGLVDVGDGLRGKPEVGGEEDVVAGGLGVAVADPAQRVRAALAAPHAREAPRQLPDRHRHELVPARHAAQLPALVVPFREGLELMPRHQLEKLRENCAIVGHRLSILVFD